MKIGDKVIIKEEICANNLINPHYNKIATVLENQNKLGLVKVSIDDFPNCNHRECHNQFWYDVEELETLQCEYLETENCELARFKEVCKNSNCDYFNKPYIGILINS